MGIKFQMKDGVPAPVLAKPSPEDDTPFPDSTPKQDSAEVVLKGNTCALCAKKGTKKNPVEPHGDQLVCAKCWGKLDSVEVAGAPPLSTSADAPPADGDPGPLDPAGQADLAALAEQAAAKPMADSAPAKVEVVQPVANVEVKAATGVVTNEQQTVGPVIHKTAPMANVGLSAAMTVNLGNFNNVKFSVSLYMPSETDSASLDATYENVKDWVDNKMADLRAAIEGED